MGVVMGAIGAAMLLIKINVGLFLLCAWGSWWLAQEVQDSRWRHYLGWAISVSVIAAPLVLMRLHLTEPWALGFAWIFSAGALGLWWQIVRSQGRDENAAGWGWLGAVGVVIGTAVASMAVRGTSPTALLEGGLLAPLRHPQMYTFPARTPLVVGSVAWVSLLAFWLTTRSRLGGWRTSIIVAVRLTGVAGYFWHMKAPHNQWGLYDYALAWGPALAGWMLIPLTEHSSRQLRARWWLGWIFVWQLLQAYPVAGSQVAWGGALWVVIAGVGCVDLGRWASVRWRWAPAVGALAWAGVALTTTGIVVRGAHNWWLDSAPLQLPGARWLRPPPDITRSLQTIQTNLQRDAGVVFSLPGMFSLNLWSGRPTPTAANTTHWFSLLNEPQQTEIVSVLAADPKAMLVVQRDLLRLLYQNGYGPSGLLADYLRTAFIPAIRLGGYDLCVKRGRRIAAYDTFRVENDRLVAMVVRPSGPAPIRLRAPARSDWLGICLTSATWSQQDATTWHIEASLPKDWPKGVQREIAIGEISVQVIPENALPAD
jgi:hypothetical protein